MNNDSVENEITLLDWLLKCKIYVALNKKSETENVSVFKKMFSVFGNGKDGGNTRTEAGEDSGNICVPEKYVSDVIPREKLLRFMLDYTRIGRNLLLSKLYEYEISEAMYYSRYDLPSNVLECYNKGKINKLDAAYKKYKKNGKPMGYLCGVNWDELTADDIHSSYMEKIAELKQEVEFCREKEDDECWKEMEEEYNREMEYDYYDQDVEDEEDVEDEVDDEQEDEELVDYGNERALLYFDEFSEVIEFSDIMNSFIRLLTDKKTFNSEDTFTVKLLSPDDSVIYESDEYSGKESRYPLSIELEKFYDGTDYKIEQGALKGVPKHQYEYGKKFVGIDDDTAIHWFKEAADQGYMPAVLELVNFYGKTEEGYRFYLKAAELGDENSQFIIAEKYHKEGDDVSAAKWHQKCADAGNAKSQSFLGKYYAESGDEVTALKWYKLAAEKGDGDAIGFMGIYYAKNGDVKTAKSMLEESFSKVPAEAKIELGKIYLNEGNASAAIKCFKQIIYNEETKYYLGLAYRDSEDYISAIDYLTSVNSSDAKTVLDELFAKLQVDAEQDNLNAQMGLVYCYARGVCCTASEELAHKWHERASKLDVGQNNIIRLDAILSQYGVFFSKTDGFDQYASKIGRLIKPKNENQEKIDKLIDAGQKAYAKGKFDDAYSKYEQAYKLSEDINILFSLCEIIRSKASINKTIDYLVKAAAKHPDNSKLHVLIGELSMSINYIKQAIKYLNMAVSLGSDEACLYLGFVYYMKKEYDKALANLNRCIDSDNYKELALYYRANINMLLGAKEKAEEDFSKCGDISKNLVTLTYFQQNILTKDSSTQYDLGYHYAHGKDNERDYREAARLYREAAEQGHRDAQYELGDLYIEGNGVSQDFEEAFKWYRKAAEQGLPMAQHVLGVCYYYGAGVTKNYAEAVQWFSKAAICGIPEAQFYYGYCYDNGIGVMANKQEAFKWYTKGAVQGNPLCQNNLGLCYYNGEGVREDKQEAVKWITKAAEQGNPRAQYCLGACYANGDGVDTNMEEAIKWLRLAAQQGQEDAIRELHNLGESF